MSLTHTASIRVSVPARTAFEFASDGLKQTHWALGSMDRTLLPNGLFQGISRWTFQPLYIQIKSNPELLLVDYYTGSEAESDRLRWAVSTRVIPGETQGWDTECCLVIMTVWRGPKTTDDQWRRTSHVWPTEIELIKSRCESELFSNV